MEILGVILTYNNLPFLKLALDQAIKFCDKVIVVEGCHISNMPSRSIDGTCNYLNSIDNDKITTVYFKNEGLRNDEYQCQLRNKYSKESGLWKPGNWVIQWDDDVAFCEEDLIKIKKCMKSIKEDTIMFRERRFGFNFRLNRLADINDLYGIKFQRIKKDCFYKPTNKLCYQNGEKYNDIFYMKDVTYFHYPYVKTNDRMKFRWKISKDKGIIQDHLKILWDNLNLNAENISEDFCKIVGGKGEFNEYDGPHPQIMKDHIWRFVKDVREQNEILGWK